MRGSNLGTIIGVFLCSICACKEDPHNPQQWEKKLAGAKRAKDRVRVLEELREPGRISSAWVAVLNGCLENEKYPDAKAAIARALGSLKDRSSVQPLSRTLDFGATDVAGNNANKEIAAALAQIGDASAAPTLLRMLRLRDPYVRTEAIQALGELKVSDALEPLTQIATDQEGEPFLSKKAIQALGELGDPRAIPTLIKMLVKERRGVSFYPESSFALFEIGPKSSAALLAVLQGTDQELGKWATQNHVLMPAIYAKAAQILGDFREKRAEKALLEQLGFKSEYADVELFVRMRAADALGRMRSKDSVRPLAQMLEEPDFTARQEYIRALVRIGSRDANSALIHAASTPTWEEREDAIAALAMLGDARDAPALQKLSQEEETLTLAECQQNPGAGCDKPAQLSKTHQDTTRRYIAIMEEAAGCHAEIKCLTVKLDSPQPRLRERAALEMGRSGQAAAAGALVKKVGDQDLDARLAAVQGILWLLDDRPEIPQVGDLRVAVDRQLADDSGKTEFVKVNEDLRRLSVELKRRLH